MLATAHPTYTTTLPSWLRTRDVLAGEEAIKNAGEQYLPRIHSHSEDEYTAYRQRATFFNATARTAEGYVGLIFRRPPFLARPEGKSGLGKVFSAFVEDADLLGG